jgi:hypothetical protein
MVIDNIATLRFWVIKRGHGGGSLGMDKHRRAESEERHRKNSAP